MNAGAPPAEVTLLTAHPFVGVSSPATAPRRCPKSGAEAWLPRLKSAYERRYALAGIGRVAAGRAVAATRVGDAAVSILGEGREASGQKAEAEEGGERQCEGTLHDLSPLVLMGSRLESDRDSVLSWRLVRGVLSHTEEKKRAFAFVRIGCDACKQAGN